MLRLIVCLLLAFPAFAADLPFVVSPNFTPTGPTTAQGALVWLHGTYAADAPGPPDEPDIVARLAGQGLDVWRFNRARGQDPLGGSGETLARGLAGLRSSGYRRIVVAGHSRGAWIALTAIEHADVVVAISPAAFGTRPERQAEGMRAWRTLWESMRRSRARVVLVQLADDPYDPYPDERLSIVRAHADRVGLTLLSLLHPAQPRGHIGVYEPEFDETLGDGIAAFVAAER